MNNVTPCHNFNHKVSVFDACVIGRRCPWDCFRCAAYVAGDTEQERDRCEAWSEILEHNERMTA